MRRPALFLDLDGTIRRSRTGGFIDGPEDVEVMDDVIEKLKGYKDQWVIGVTNQGGVAFGHKSLEDVKAENEETVEQLPSGIVDEIKFCPYHPDSDHPEWGQDSRRRKPNPGMIEDAADAMRIDLERSTMVGDRPEDRKCAKKAGVNFVSASQFFNREEM